MLPGSYSLFHLHNDKTKHVAFFFQSEPHKVVYHNAVRTAEVNLGRFKKFFYAQSDQPPVSVNMTTLEARKQLKLNNNCKDMDWFMNNIIPEMPIPPSDAVYFESLTHDQTQKCLTVSDSDKSIVLEDCHLLKREQVFYLDTKKKFRAYKTKQCIGLNESRLALKDMCMENWTYENKQLKNMDRCIVAKDSRVVSVESCEKVGRESYWTFRYHFNWTKPLQYHP